MSGYILFAGTRIIYDRQFLMRCKQSPLAKSPPPNMAVIPGVTSPGVENVAPQENGHEPATAGTAPKSK